VRGVMVAGRARVPVMRVLSSELIERVSDAVAIILVVWFTLRGLTLTLALRLALGVLELGVGLAVLFGILLVIQNVNIRHRLEAWEPAPRAWRRVKRVAVEAIDAAARLTIRTLFVALSAALAATAVNVVSLWCLLRAYHLRLSPLDAAAVFAIITIGTFLPNAPGNLGPWQVLLRDRFTVVWDLRRSSRWFQLGCLLPLGHTPHPHGLLRASHLAVLLVGAPSGPEDPRGSGPRLEASRSSAGVSGANSCRIAPARWHRGAS